MMLVYDAHVKGPDDVAAFKCRFDKTGIRCGGCSLGLVKPRLGNRCKVCNRKVVYLVRNRGGVTVAEGAR